MDSKFGHIVAAIALLSALGCSENLTPVPERVLYDPQDALPELACVPDLDGALESRESVSVTGVGVSYLVNPPGTTREVNLAGLVNDEGERRWEFDEVSPADQLDRIQATELTGKWYAESFPEGQLVLRAYSRDLGATFENVYRRTDSELLLLGTASLTPDPPQGKTLLVYDRPIALVRFPLEEGASWVSVGEVRNATFFGLPYAGRATYEVDVEAVGELVLPDLTFEQVHMVRTRVITQPAVGQPSTLQQLSFFAECFGEVARAVSAANQEGEFFSPVQEFRRLGLGYDDAQAL